MGVELYHTTTFVQSNIYYSLVSVYIISILLCIRFEKIHPHIIPLIHMFPRCGHEQLAFNKKYSLSLQQHQSHSKGRKRSGEGRDGTSQPPEKQEIISSVTTKCL